jgi:cytoskeleton protein RodZ
MSQEIDKANQQVNQHSCSELESALPSIGMQLREAREAKKLSVEQIAAEMYLAAHIITELEQDSYEKLGDTYAKGYIRGYATLLHLPADQLIKQFEQSHEKSEHDPFYKTHIEKEQKQQASFAKASKHELLKNLKLSNIKLTPKAKLRYITYVISVIIIVMMIVWWNNHDQPSKRNINVPTANQTIVVDTANQTNMTQPAEVVEKLPQSAEKSKPLTQKKPEKDNQRVLTAKLNMDNY